VTRLFSPSPSQQRAASIYRIPGTVSVVIADIPEPDGTPCDHEHTAMVFRPPDESGNLYLLAISTKFSRPVGRFMIEVPYGGGRPSCDGSIAAMRSQVRLGRAISRQQNPMPDWKHSRPICGTRD